ncbi:MAG: OmpA family protein, partial [Pseudomonadota bacterium]
GELVVHFTDNRLIDVAGSDLYVFEVGPDVEATGMAISEDGEEWVRVGSISGGKAEVDIAPYVSPDDAFRFVKLVDLRDACGTRTPGADIDAIGAMGSAARIALDSAVLFDSGEYRLRQGGTEELDRVIARMGDPEGSRVEVAGHTDSVGSASDNLQLSESRARTVADYLTDHAGFSDGAVTTRALGESRPLVSNDTAEGRARNRRVELTVRTTPEAEQAGEPRVEHLGIWYSESNEIIELQRQGDQVTGHYTSSDGVLTGEFVEDDVFEGFWIRDSSRMSCGSEKQGSDHWGGIRLEFDSPALDSFTGYWRYCDEDEDRGQWSEAGRML